LASVTLDAPQPTFPQTAAPSVTLDFFAHVTGKKTHIQLVGGQRDMRDKA
jgi:hypothetical protein